MHLRKQINTNDIVIYLPYLGYVEIKKLENLTLFLTSEDVLLMKMFTFANESKSAYRYFIEESPDTKEQHSG